MKLFRRVVILAHRYLGIALSLLVIMWFATGITMMYVGGMPRLTPQMRLDRMPALDLSKVRITPARAAEAADSFGRATLLTVMDRPAYRFGGRGAATVFADSGELLEELTEPQSRTVASKFMNVPEERLQFVSTITRADQWTLIQGARPPLHKFRVDDEDGTELYVAAQTGEVTMFTTRRTRGFAWISTIPHWLYFTALRTNQPLWYRIVVWTSALACALSVLGLVLGITQFRRSRPFSLAKSIPYSGALRWHYVTGVVFGVFTLTWAFSGLLSMEPFEWTNAQGLEVPRDVLSGGPADLTQFPAMEPAAWARILDGRVMKEVEFARIQDEHYFVVRHTPPSTETPRRERLHQPYYITGRIEPERLLVAAASLDVRREPFSADSLLQRLRTGVPDAPILESEVLTDYDSYYYSRGRQTPLPVLRVKFGDPGQTWLYVDPEMSQVVSSIHRLNRVERWLYNGLHSLDFSFWYNRRPLWDVGMIVLLVGGLTSSTLGLVMGIRRLRRGTSRAVKSLTVPPAVPSPDAAGARLSRTEVPGH